MFGLYCTVDNVVLEHAYGSRHGAREKLSSYINNKNLYVFEYDVLYNTAIVVSKKHKDQIQKELTNRGIKR